MFKKIVLIEALVKQPKNKILFYILIHFKRLKGTVNFRGFYRGKAPILSKPALQAYLAPDVYIPPLPLDPQGLGV
jgi:hypothetical protein